MIPDALAQTAQDLLVGLALALLAALFIWALVRSNEKLQRREDARRGAPFTPAGSDDLRRALRYQGVSPSLLGQEHVGLHATSQREARRG